MEFKNHDKLQILARKTWDLHVRINKEINGLNCCTHYCVDAACCSLEKMIAIRDSLKDVHTTLIFLQRIKSSQSRKRDDAIVLVEESRRALIDRINEFTEKGGRTRSEVVEELIITFVKDDGKNEFPRSGKNLFSSFVVNTIRFGLEFVVTFASIYAGVMLYDGMQKKKMKKKKNVRLVEEVFGLVPMDSSIPLDVSCGKG